MSMPRPVRLHHRLAGIAAFLVAVGFCTVGHAGGNAMAPEKESASRTLWLYVGTYTGGKTPSEGIYLLELDLASGSLTNKGAVARLKDPSFLAIHPSRKFLYAVNELGQFQRQEGGRRQRAGDRPGDRRAEAPEPAIVGRQRPLPPDRRPHGERRPGGQLRQRQRRLPADP